MRFDRRLQVALAVAGVALVGLSGCSVSPDEDSPTVAYQDAESDQPLEVPPDLTQPEQDQSLTIPARQAAGRDGKGATGSAEAGSKEGRLLPQFDGLRFVRGEQTAWIEVANTPPERIWPRLQGFLESQGLSVARKKPELGLIETPWFDRGDRPDQGGISGFISGLFSGEGGQTRRHKYQIRLERADGGTRIFLEHRRVAEVADSQNPKQTSAYSWQPQGGNPAVENEMRQRLLVYLGVSEQRARGVLSSAEAEAMLGGDAVLKGQAGESVAIQVDDSDYRRVYAQVGRALDAIGAQTTEAARSEGHYRINWTPPPAVRNGDAAKRSFQVKLRRRNERIQIVAADANGDRGNGPVHRALLSELVKAMGGREEPRNAGEQSVPTPGSSRGSDGQGTTTGGGDDDPDFEDADGDGLPDNIPGS